MTRLLWKEWREQSWKLAFGSILLAALALIGLRTQVTPDSAMMMAVCFLGLSMLPVLASTGLVPAERGEGCLESLLALPVAPWKILLAKTLLGVLLCAVPLLAACAGSLLVAANREVPTLGILILFGRTILTTLSLFVWMLALTIRLPSETRASLLAVGILIIWLMVGFGVTRSVYPIAPPIALAAIPFAFITFGLDRVPAFGIVLLVQATIALALWLWAAHRLRSFSEAE